MQFGDDVDLSKRPPDLGAPGWACLASFVLIVVTATVTLVFTLTKSSSLDNRQGLDDEAELRVNAMPDLSNVVRPREASVQPESAQGFFFEIGSNSQTVLKSVRTRHLEDKGWEGVCAVPFPGDFSERKCKVIALPISGTSGQSIHVPDCSQSSTLGSIVRSVRSGDSDSGCPTVEAKTLGIAELLYTSGAPKVIDYMGLDSFAWEVDILNSFPFDKYCVRSWTVYHNYEPEKAETIRHTLEVAQGCRVREGSGEFWARCSCSGHTEMVATETGTVREEDLKRGSTVTMTAVADGHIVSK